MPNGRHTASASACGTGRPMMKDKYKKEQKHITSC